MRPVTHLLGPLFLSLALLGCSESDDTNPAETPVNAGGGSGFGVGASRPGSPDPVPSLESPIAGTGEADGSVIDDRPTPVTLPGEQGIDFNENETVPDGSDDDTMDELTDDDALDPEPGVPPATSPAEAEVTEGDNDGTDEEVDDDGTEDEVDDDSDTDPVSPGATDDATLDPAIVGLWDFATTQGALREEAWLEITAAGQYRVFEYRGDEVDMNAGTDQNCYELYTWALEPLGDSRYNLRFDGAERSEDANDIQITASGNTLSIRFVQGADSVVNSVPRVIGLSTADFNLCTV